jgi:predicted ATPase
VRNGRGQIVCLRGEAGLGKSRLLAEIAEYWALQNSAESWHIMYGIPYDSARPFGLIQNYARTMFGIKLDDPAEILKHDIYEQMYPGLRATARGAPTVLVADDLHWADTASTDLMMHLMELTEEVPILFLFAFRPERQSPAWQVKQKAETDYPHRYTDIALTPLGESDTNTLISSLLNVTNLPPELHRLILRKTDGNPYFVEEVVHSLVDQGIVHRTANGLQWDETKDIESVKIPDSLHALLMARIDRLDQEAKSTLQMASVIGRSFYFRILEAISESGIAVDRHLSSLERVELLREAGRNPELEYIFKHELARDAAYATILNRKRAEFHLRVAEAIESLFPDRLEENAHRLAQHFRLGGDRKRALKYFEMAANVADRVNAREEGLEHHKSALEVAGEIGVSDDAIAILSGKRDALSATKALANIQ